MKKIQKRLKDLVELKFMRFNHWVEEQKRGKMKDNTEIFNLGIWVMTTLLTKSKRCGRKASLGRKI